MQYEHKGQRPEEVLHFDAKIGLVMFRFVFFAVSTGDGFCAIGDDANLGRRFG
jgi:hypothetical protein